MHRSYHTCRQVLHILCTPDGLPGRLLADWIARGVLDEPLGNQVLNHAHGGVHVADRVMGTLVRSTEAGLMELSEGRVLVAASAGERNPAEVLGALHRAEASPLVEGQPSPHPAGLGARHGLVELEVVRDHDVGPLEALLEVVQRGLERDPVATRPGGSDAVDLRRLCGDVEADGDDDVGARSADPPEAVEERLCDADEVRPVVHVRVRRAPSGRQPGRLGVEDQQARLGHRRRRHR